MTYPLSLVMTKPSCWFLLQILDRFFCALSAEPSEKQWDKDSCDKSCKQHAAEHAGAHGLAGGGSRPGGKHQGEDTQDKCHGGHHNRAETQPCSLKGRLCHRHAYYQLRAGGSDDDNSFLCR